MSVSSERMRIEWAQNDAIRDQGLKTPDDVERFDDLVYGPDPAWNKLDVYRPKGMEGKLPVIVNVHGGGWVYGDKELYQFYAMSLAQRGFAVVNYTYRLAPEFKFPAPLIDMNDVVAWMFEHQNEYGLDMKHVFTVGDSAGGHLSALYAAVCTNPEYASNYHFRVPNDFKPEAVALNCGVYVIFGDEPVISESEDQELFCEDLLPEHGSEKERGLLNVTDHVNEGFPPAYVMTCVGDFCRTQAPLLVKVFQEKNIPHEFVTYGSEEKPLYHVFHVTIQETEGQKCNDDECAFFKRIMGQ